jgi:hypothetical protein
MDIATARDWWKTAQVETELSRHVAGRIPSEIFDFLFKELTAAKEEIKALRDGCTLAGVQRLIADLETCGIALVSERKETERLREALQEYGQHSNGCSGWRFGATCSCGYQAALQERQGEE